MLDTWCERVGRDPAEVERTVLIDESTRSTSSTRSSRQARTHLIVELGTKGEEPFDLAPVQRLLDLRG